MRIVAYHSEDAHPDVAWIAYYEVDVVPSKANRVPDAANPAYEDVGRGKPDFAGYLPLRHSGSTKEEAVGRADAHLADTLKKRAAERATAALNAKKFSERAAAKRAAS